MAPRSSSSSPRAKKTGGFRGAESDTQIRRFLGRYSPEIEAQLREARDRLCGHFPRGFELVFDNYNALVFAMSATEASRDAFISVAGYPKWVTLFFLHGASLRDPHRLLEGTGKRVRSIRLSAASDLARREVRTLIEQAIAPFGDALRAAPPRTTIIKTVVVAQRSRRPPPGKPAAKSASVAVAKASKRSPTKRV